MGGAELTGLEVAIVGMACRFPGAADAQAFWRNLREGVESITFLKDEELEASAIDPSPRSDPNYVKAAALLEGADLFDAAFFGFTPKEAEVMDPQHRVFLECAWEALEDAGYDPERHRGGIGVYAGARTNTYVFNLFSNPAALGALDPFEIGLGNDLAFLTTRASHRLNLRGPAYSLHTACSTALVAVHLACQGLLANECKLAIAGGVAINVPQKTGYLYQFGGITSPDGHCRAFDAKAQGTLFGSGVGLVVLKRLEDAIADGDTIHAIIKGSAINNDGSAKASFTAPGVQGQTKVIKDALAAAEVDARSISYVEAHGTGTALGDPIELRALTKAFRADTDEVGFCAIGSVKTNMGHLDAAAGAASLIKAVQALAHEEIPPSLHFEKPNPQIDFESSPFFVNTRLRPWPRGEAARRAGVSSFGVGGTNAHVVLEEAPPSSPAAPGRPWELLVLSAKTASALESATRRLADHLERHPEQSFADVAWTLQVGRQAFKHRRVLACRGREEAVQALRAADPSRVLSGEPETRQRPVAFLFPDMGAQPLQAAAELYRAEPAFRAELDTCAQVLTPRLGEDVRTVLVPSGGAVAQVPSRLALPALFAFEYALARLWLAWGLKPEALLACGAGEYAAACVAGVLTLEEAAALVTRKAGQTPGDVAVQPKAPSIPHVSCATGTWVSAEEVSRPQHWDAARPAERFSEALRELQRESPRVLLEVGPGQALAARAAQAGVQVVASTRGAEEGGSDAACLQEALGRLWLAGVEVGWAAVHSGEKRRRLPLPTYPFERQRYWIGPGERTSTAQAQQGPMGKLPEVADWFHVAGWRRTAPPSLRKEALAARGCWLLFMDGLGVGEALAARLEAEGQEVVRVSAGAGLRREGERRYVLEPGRAEQYVELLEGLVAQGLRPSVLVHLWSLTPAGEVASGPALFGELQPRGYYSLLYLGQSLAQVLPEQVLRLEVITNRLHDLEGEHGALVEKATLLGPCKVIPQEQQNVSCRCIDVELPAAGGLELLGSRLLAELSTSPTHLAVAWRGPRRYLQVYEPLRLEGGEHAFPLRQGGVYLMTGGLGGVGELLGEHLAEALKARLVLVGRTPLPERGAWETWLAGHEAQDKVSRQIRLVQRLEHKGAQVLVLTADMADARQVRAALAQAEQHFGPVNGVLHAAGITHGPSLYGALTDMGPSESEAQFGPKVYGTYALEEALRGRSPDFVLLFSSNAAVLGGLGYVTYASANLFLDAFAASRRTQGGTRWLSASWDPWPEQTRHYSARTSMDRYAMTVAESVEAFRRLASTGVDGPVVVATGDLPYRLGLWINRGSAPKALAAPSSRARRARGVYVEPTTPLERKVAELWQELLGVEQVGLHDDFFDLGGHSLLATRIIGRLRTDLNVDLAISKLFEVSTVAGLARAIAELQAQQEQAQAEELLQQVASMSEEELERELARRAAEDSHE
ncbi:MAG: SDR family oxidoreductase [Myxococcaceae bacterium]|nr:SDR family oxidoreductase [Myxococcaceae bacterium]